MPHYKDGTEARIGDLVRGKGYNIRGADGQPKEIVGTVLTVNPGATSCNCTISITEIVKEVDSSDFQFPNWEYYSGAPKDGYKIIQDCARSKVVVVRYVTEYGQCDHFELLHRAAELSLA